MRLLKGVILNQQGKSDAALTEFTELSREYPELPEPHNNLAVIHAQAGRLEAARDALEAAIRLNRDYATAHRNLGDVYLRLAAQTYQEAQRLAPNDPSLTPRLQALKALPDTGAPPR
jgi:Flp pilus assembly protein TadD